MGRVGRFAAAHARGVILAWVVVALGLGALAPGVEKALSGAGWEASGSESVEARDRIDAAFDGQGSYALQVVVSGQDASAVRAALPAVQDTLRRDDRVSHVIPPRAGSSLTPDGRTAIVLAGAAAAPDDMVRAADDLKKQLADAPTRNVAVDVAGAPGMWSDFNEANRSAMLKSELISWPVTLTILLLAFGSLVAAGLPLMLTMVGLVSAAGVLFLGAQLFDISIWAMNFALMFALALGIDYALFIVARFRQALHVEGLGPTEAVISTMETAGKAVLFSGVTVLIALSAVLLVPSPAFRSMAVGIMVAVAFVLAASLSLLPAVLARRGSRVDRFATPWLVKGDQRSARLGRWAQLGWRRPGRFLLAGLLALTALAWPVGQLDTGMPSIAVVPAEDGSRQGYEQVQRSFGEGAPGTLQVVTARADAGRATALLERDPGIARVLPSQEAAGDSLLQAVPVSGPSDDGVRTTIDRVRDALPAGALLGGAVAENHDLEQVLGERTPFVIGTVLVLGFVLLLVALQAPLLALVGVALNVLATLAAFGVAKWIFQDGVGADLLGFEPQGYLDAWAPVFFFAMLFALGMDYTVFLLASAKEHWDRTGDARIATVEGIARSGRVITAAAGVMVAVFFTFALSGPLPPKEMGVILGVAVLVDAALVRLVLMPAVMRLLGPAGWWAPRWLRRVLPDIRFGH
ncbi:MAG: family transporter [Solirubrobacterales bacterium]|jgi:RND superfamily putative drug exporter|nr:family transporter [Solirubrobacterales bacterium]